MKLLNRIIIISLVFVVSNSFAQNTTDPILTNYGWGINFTQNGKKLKPRHLIAVTKVNAEALKEIQIAKKNYTMSKWFSIPGEICVGLFAGQLLGKKEFNVILFGIGAGLIGVSIPFSKAYSKHAKNGVNIYNEGLKQSDLGKVDFSFGLTQYGIGLNMTF